jgi:2-amino-4-hydroxy-6-hydroxymethyldihydropteridine diphosphokinase/dihydropteroate synthase
VIILGLGSSQNDALSWLRRALAALKQSPSLRIDAVSPVYRSDALLPPGAPPSWNVPYLNLAVACEPALAALDPPALLDELKALEKRLGRRERERWAPREIDIDVLAWDGIRLDSERLTLPHPGLVKRPFALLPLADVSPSALSSLGADAREQARRWKALPAEDVPFRTRKTSDRLTELVAILNLTPDSFSDDGKFSAGDSLTAVLAHARQAVDDGATVLDIGAESTRPGATPLDDAEEWRRLTPVIPELLRLRDRTPGLKLSLDSRHAGTWERAMDAGRIDWLNDVSGLRSERMRAMARNSGSDVVVMHSLGIPPARARTLPLDQDPLEALARWGRETLDELERAGIAPERVVLDPGVGFGKTPEQNLHVLREAASLHELRARLLVGHSRKSFIANIQRHTIPPAGRDLETAILSAHLADQGIEYLRVHDVSSQARALRLSAAWDGTARWHKS